MIGAAPQFLAHHREGVGAEDHLVDLGRLGRLVAAQDIVDAQHQFARLEGLGQVVVGAGFQALDAGVRFRQRRQHQDRHGLDLAQAVGQRDAAFARHHHIDDQKVEVEADQLAPCFVRVGRGRHAKSLLDQIAVQEIADAPVVVDDQKVSRIVRDSRFCRHSTLPWFQAPEPSAGGEPRVSLRRSSFRRESV
ncbi:hypothetical protein D9M72_552730 [compost metagenome]